MMSLLALVPPLTLLVAALALPSGRWALRLPVVAGWSAAAVALVVLVVGGLPAVTAVLLAYTTAVVAVVATFSSRHLEGDPRRRRYGRALLLAAASALVVVVSDNLVLTWSAWVVTGLALATLIGHHDRTPTTPPAVLAWRRHSAVSDVALLLAVLVLWAGSGQLSIDAVGAWARATSDTGLLVVAALLLVVAAASRAGLWPFARWLPLSVVAPAPVSALLHAGIVNAPVVVLLALEPVWRAAGVATVALALVGFGTAALVFPRKLVRPDVKTRLAWSTSAQMGFMLGLLVVAPAAAVLHMILHGIYKASAFLGAGSQLDRLRQPRARRESHAVAVAGASGGVLVAAAWLVLVDGIQQPVGAAALVVASGAAGYGLFSRQARWRTRAAAIAVVGVVVALFSVGAHVAGDVLGLPTYAPGPVAWTTAALLLTAAVIFAWLGHRQPPRAWARLHRWAAPEGRTGGGRVGPVPAVTGTTPEVRARVSEQVALAAAGIPPSWSWDGFIATNPLLGLTDRPFDEAAASVAARGWATLPGLAALPSPRADRVDTLISGWLAAWTDRGDTVWPAPGRDRGLWDWFRSVAGHDPVFDASVRPWLTDLPDDPADVVALGVREAGEPLDACEVWLRQQLLRTRGWAGFLGRRGTPEAALNVGVLVELVAVRVAVRLALGEADHEVTGSIVPAPDARNALTRLRATESAVRVPLLTSLVEASRGGVGTPAVGARSAADLVFCIDPRSERLRRRLEAQGDYRTLGFAGFFGFSVQTCEAGRTTMRHPVLLRPAQTLTLREPGHARLVDLLGAALGTALNTVGGGFAAVEPAALLGVGATARTVFPRLSGSSGRRPADQLDAPASHDVEAAARLVEMTGLHGPETAPVVVLVGHRSSSVNNPTASAFDCGACGGQGGAFNARLAAAALNDPGVRANLHRRGLTLPDDTVVVAAEHDTATDVVRLLDRLPAVGGGEELERALERAGEDAALERARALGVVSRRPQRALRAVRRRSQDWATVRHEWGLAGNIAFVAAPRSLTAGLDLGGKVFLHDYRADQDPHGATLETILTAPLVVAQWINAQYFFSALDPDNLGSGSKTAHNPVGGIGVMAGGAGDLLTGLPEQSVRYDAATVHQPVRLLAVVAAEVDAIEAVLARHPAVADLVGNDWLALCALDVASGTLHRVTGAAGSGEVTAGRVTVADPAAI